MKIMDVVQNNHRTAASNYQSIGSKLANTGPVAFSKENVSIRLFILNFLLVN